MTSVSITYTNPQVVDVIGLNNIDADVTLGLPQPFKTDSTITVEPLKADLDTNSELKIDPLTADIDTKSELKIEPLKTESSVFLDVKPAVVDLCLTLNVGKTPNVCVKSPYRSHIGFTIWGTEIMGFTVSGEQETVIQEQHPQPKVAFGEVANEWRGHHEWPGPHQHHGEVRDDPGPPTKETGGLRIRLGN